MKFPKGKIKRVLLEFEDGWFVKETTQSKVVKSFIRTLLKNQRQEILEVLLKNGHGGGNWRRLIEELKEKSK